MAVFDLTFPSSNGRDDVRAWVHTPVAERPRGLVQIVHGFGEHARRYLPLVSALLDAGYAVALDDHLGHGTTAVANDSWGDSGGADPGSSSPTRPNSPSGRGPSSPTCPSSSSATAGGR